jgi:prepilin-type N-terminal cleavage/methylation domain-containing protein
MKTPLEGPRSARPARGFTLIEIVVVMFILGVAIAMAVAITNALTASQRLTTTTARMQTVDAALVQYVMQQKRLPCPADGTQASSSSTAGNEGGRNSAGCTTNEAGGVVPWRALGLAETDVTDGWNRRLTYRIQPGLAADNALDMSSCDPAKAATGGATASCSASCTSSNIAGTCTAPFDFLTGKGLQVKNVSGTVIMDPAGVFVSSIPPTGAAYVVISAGSTGGGAYLSSGQLSTSTTTDGTQEQKNYANAAYVAGTSYYVDDSISDGAGASHFDDIVSRPALLTVINKAGLGPRSHS